MGDGVVHDFCEDLTLATTELRRRTLEVLPGLWWKLWYCARVERREQHGFQPEPFIRTTHLDILDEIISTPLSNLLVDAEENGAEQILITHMRAEDLAPGSLFRHSFSHFNSVVSNVRALLRARRQREAAVAVQPLLHACSRADFIGLSVRDAELRFVGLNPAAAAMLGATPEDYIGRTSREVMGELGEVVEQILEDVRTTGQFVSTSLNGRLPGREGEGEWLIKYLPLRAGDSRIYAIAAFLIEVTAERQLQARVTSLKPTEMWSNPALQRWADNVRDSLMVFDLFLDQSLSSLISRRAAMTPVLHRVVSLDQRVSAVQNLVALQTEFFPAA